MALQRNRPAALRRKVTTYGIGGDVVASLVIAIAISQMAGLVVFIIGLALVGLAYYNITQVMKTRGY